MTGGGTSDADAEIALWAIASAFLGGIVALVAVEWPVLVWSTVHGAPTVMDVPSAIGGGVRWLIVGPHHDPSAVPAWRTYRDVLPPPRAWLLLNLVLVGALVALLAVIWMRVDRWRGRRRVGLPAWDPRSKVAARAWARPRDLIHLRPRHPVGEDPWRRLLGRVTRAVYRERRAPESRGGDGWALGRLRGAELRSEPEMHLMAVAPTRSGKTTRVVVPALLEHDGPAIVLSNKLDVVSQTLSHRGSRVWVYAPMADADALPLNLAGWTPLLGCEQWEHALRMGRWIFDADPSASASASDSGGARFYNREAVAVVLPPLLHAAALGGRSMGAVHDWLRSGVSGLDAPREVLAGHSAYAAADATAGVQALDDRPRSLLLMSAAQLVDAYRFPQVQGSDRPDFRPADLLDGGTLYLIAPESEQEMLAPLFGGILGAVLRCWERETARRGAPPAARLRILADEAAHLAPLAKLPTYLAVSAGWGVRWCLIYQSLAQLQHRYGREADAVLGNALCKLFLGPIQDETTRRYLVDLLDEETETSVSHTSSALGSSRSTTRHERPSSKVSAQRLMQLEFGQAVVVHGRDLPAVTRLGTWWEQQ